MKWFTIKEVMDYFQVSRQTIYRWHKRGLLKICWIDNRVPRIAEEDVQKLEERMREER